METLDIVKNYLQENKPDFMDANVRIDDHIGGGDAHFIPLLDDVNHEDISHENYQIATVSKMITLDDGIQIPKILKLTVKNNQVEKVIESK